MPILRIRLVDESGESSTGGRATAGSCGADAREPLLHELRASMQMSVPGSKSSTTDDRPSTDFERSCVMRACPRARARAASVTSGSTSSLESPGASVCTSTRGGANSGNASNDALRRPARRDTTNSEREADDDPALLAGTSR